MSSGRVVLDFGSSSNNNNNNASNSIPTTNQLSIPLMEGSSLCVYHVNCPMARNPVTQQQRFHGGQVLHMGRDFHSDDRITLSHPRNDVSFHLDIKSFSSSSSLNEGTNNNNQFDGRNTSSFLSSTSNYNKINNNNNSSNPSFLGATLVNGDDENDDFNSANDGNNSNGTDFLAATLVVDQNTDSQVMFLDATQVVSEDSNNNNNNNNNINIGNENNNHLQQDHALFNAETQSFSSDDDDDDHRKNSNSKNHQENDNGNSPDFDLLFGSSKKQPQNNDNITQRHEPVHQDKSSTTTSNQNTMTSPPQLNRKLDVPNPYAVQERSSGKIRGRSGGDSRKNQRGSHDDDGGETEVDEDDGDENDHEQSLNLPMKRNNNTGSECQKFEVGSLPSPPPLPQPSKGSETQVIAGSTLGYDSYNSAYFSNSNANSSFIGATLVSDADQDDNMKQNSFHSKSFYSSVNYSAIANKNNSNNICSTTTTGSTLLPKVCTPAENVGIGAELLFPQDPFGLSTSPLNNQKQLSPTNISMLLPGNQQQLALNNKNNDAKQALLNATPEDSPQDKAASDKKKKNLKQSEKNGTGDVSDAETELFEADENNNTDEKKEDDGNNKIPTSGIRWQVFLGDDEDDENSWKTYPQKVQDILEQTFAKYKAAKKKTKDVNQVAIDDVYLVDVRVKMQKRIDDNSRQRQVRRLEE